MNFVLHSISSIANVINYVIHISGGSLAKASLLIFSSLLLPLTLPYFVLEPETAMYANRNITEKPYRKRLRRLFVEAEVARVAERTSLNRKVFIDPCSRKKNRGTKNKKYYTPAEKRTKTSVLQSNHRSRTIAECIDYIYTHRHRCVHYKLQLTRT